MIDFLKSKEIARIKDLEQTLERYRENDRNQHKEIKRLKKFELKYKILEQYLNDDEAILELLECHKKKESIKKSEQHDLERYGYGGLQANAPAMGRINAGNPFYPLGNDSLFSNPFE